MPEITIYAERCRGCGNCVINCPINAKIPKTASGKPQNAEEVICIEKGIVAVLNKDKCISCKMCMNVCPVDAIAVVK